MCRAPPSTLLTRAAPAARPVVGVVQLGDLMKLSCKRGKVVVMAPGVAGALAATDGARGAEAVAVGVLDGEPDDAAFRFQSGDHDGAGDAYNDDYDSDGGEGGGFMLAGDESVAGSGDGVVPVSHDFQGLLVDKAERVEKIDIAYAKVAKKVRSWPSCAGAEQRGCCTACGECA